MNFSEATKIAKAHPGSVIRRAADGSYVVEPPRGAVERSPAPVVRPVLDRKSQEVSRLRSELGAIKAERKERILAIEAVNQDQIAHLRDYHARDLRAIRLRYKQREESLLLEIQGLKSDIQVLQGANERLSAELKTAAVARSRNVARAKQPTTNDSTELGESLLNERRVVNCSCHGEVENCFKCDGTGRYTVNGYGNPV